MGRQGNFRIHCAFCGKQATMHQDNARFCSTVCNHKANRWKKAGKVFPADMPTKKKKRYRAVTVSNRTMPVSKNYIMTNPNHHIPKPQPKQIKTHTLDLTNPISLHDRYNTVIYPNKSKDPNKVKTMYNDMLSFKNILFRKGRIHNPYSNNYLN